MIGEERIFVGAGGEDLGLVFCRPDGSMLRTPAASPRTEYGGSAAPPSIGPLLTSYLNALLAHRTVAVWVDADKSVLNHSEIGTRLRVSNRNMRSLLVGDDASRAARVRAAAVLGAVWRPIRNLTDIDGANYRDDIIATALGGFQR